LRFRTTLAAAAVAALAVTAPAAMAHEEDTVEVSGGTVKLALNGKTKKALKKGGVTVSGKSFAITEGELDPVGATHGELSLKGKITFKHGKAKAVFKGLEIADTGSKSKLTGKLGAKTVTIANLKGGEVERHGLEETHLHEVSATLTKGAAKAINKKVGGKAAKKGARLGEVEIDAELAEALIEATGQTTVEFSAESLQKFTDAGVTISTTTPATEGVGPNGRRQPSFPITGGKANPQTLFGVVNHAGGIVFSEGASQLPLAELGVENSATGATLTVAFGGARAAAANLDLSGMTRTSTANGVALGNVVVKLNDAAAALLNATFNPSGTTTFASGDVLGTAASNITFK
jgi:hypothetical protein